MRRPLLVAALTAALVAPAAPALAHPDVPLDPTLSEDLTYAATDNVEYLGRFPEHQGSAGGARSKDGKRYFLTDPRGVYVYDTTKPETPTLLGSLPLVQTGGGTGQVFAQEDPATNDRILLVDALAPDGEVGTLHVVDVSNPKALKTLSTVPVTDHTWTCVTGKDATGKQNSCAYAYGRSGHIVDLTNPAKATLAKETWRAAVGYGNRTNSPYTHDLTEIRPGLVMSAGSTAILMDTRDPRAPKRLTAIEQPKRFSSLGYHSVEWADGGRSPWVVLGTEIGPSAAGSDCKGPNSVVETWDARPVIAALTRYEKGGSFGGAAFKKVDTFDAASRGIFLQGGAPAHVDYCAHWMELRPGFTDSGLMAISYYDRGTRFVQVGKDGRMKEIGWVVSAEGYSGSPQWVTKDVVYVSDYRRGLEVLKLKSTKASAVHSNVPALVHPSSQVRVPSHGHFPVVPAALGGLALLLLLVQCERVVRRRAAFAAA